MEPLFKKLYTIELSEKYYKNTKAKYCGNKIKFLLGDSSIVLQYILPTITEKCILFLDGHWSSDDTGRGEKDCPLLEEVTYINELCKMEAIIIIDDLRLFENGPNTGLTEDWSDISKNKILEILQDRISKVYHLDSDNFKNDRLIIHINAIIPVDVSIVPVVVPVVVPDVVVVPIVPIVVPVVQVVPDVPVVVPVVPVVQVVQVVPVVPDVPDVPVVVPVVPDVVSDVVSEVVPDTNKELLNESIKLLKLLKEMNDFKEQQSKLAIDIAPVKKSCCILS